jgi:hypothetical protein
MDKILFISLGHDCFVKSYLINSLKNQLTYIFDLLRFFYVKDIVILLKNEFNNFMNKEDFVSDDESPIGETQPSPNLVHKFNKRFNYTVKHDFTLEDNFDEVKEKYNRRIDRFKKDIKISNTVYIRFIFNDKIEDYLELYKELTKITSKCILILIHNNDNFNFNYENIFLIKHNNFTLFNKLGKNHENIKSIILQIKNIVNSVF